MNPTLALTRRSFLFLTLAAFLALLAPPQATAQQKVDLELILMADGSGSVDEGEFTLQRLGYARALRNPRVLSAIRNGPLGRIALSYVEWSGHFLKAVIVPWTVVKSAADMEIIAQKLESHPRQIYGGGTAVGSAILYGAESILNNQFKGTRRVIDLSGDGPDKDGIPASVGRDQAVAMGVTINGLPILTGEFGLDIFFLDNVIGGPGAFSIPARGFKDFYSAILTKLIREIAGIQDPDAPQAATDAPSVNRNPKNSLKNGG
ncbi:MAG: hypothetical protein ACI82H_000766 [Alphaproteobacteria bacterium]|jgi:hypothetical protein